MRSARPTLVGRVCGRSRWIAARRRCGRGVLFNSSPFLEAWAHLQQSTLEWARYAPPRSYRGTTRNFLVGSYSKVARTS
jgi:hypothetical protein